MKPTPGCRLNSFCFLPKTVDTKTAEQALGLARLEAEALYEQRQLREQIEALDQRIAGIRREAKHVEYDIADEDLQTAELELSAWID